MAVGDTAGEARPRKVVASAAGRRKAEIEAEAEAAAAAEPAEGVDESQPLIKEADPEFERLLAEEEEIERTTREHHETPHFRPGDGD